MIRKTMYSLMFLLFAVTSNLSSQTPAPTTALQYPFKKSDMPGQGGSTVPAHESQKRCGGGGCGWNYTEEAQYTHPTQGYTYNIYHPAWDMNVIGTGGTNQDTGTKLKAVADGVVIAPSVQTFNNNKQPSDGVGEYYIPSLWNELLIKHNVGGKEWITAYGHSGKIYVKKDDIVQVGQVVAEMGEVGSPGAPHVHLEVRDVASFYSGPLGDVNKPNFWDNSQTQNNVLHDMSNVTSWYYHPELFIKGYPALGRTVNSTHIAAAQFIDAYDRNQIGKKGANPWDEYQYYDQLVDRGTGDIYVHDWNGFDIQDLSNVKDGKNAALIYNAAVPGVYYIQDPHLDHWFTTSWQYGAPFTDPISVKFSNQTESYLFAQPGDSLVVQKLGDPDGAKRTLVENVTTGEINIFPLGIFSIDYTPLPEEYPGEHQWYIIINSNPTDDIPWPLDNTPAPTGDWALAPGAYNFVRHDAEGNRVGGSGFSVQITEGNKQFADPSGGPPPADPAAVTNLTATAVSGTQVNLSWSDPNSPAAVPYQVNRDGSAIATVSTLSYTDTSVQPGNTYSYTVSANSAPESGMATVATPEETGPVGSGWLSVSTDPQGAEVYLGGVRWPDANTVTNISATEVQAGIYSLTIKRSGYADHEQNVTINADQTTVVSVTLQPPSFPMTLEAETDFTSAGGYAIAGGYVMESYQYPLIAYDISFPEQGDIEIEVIARRSADIGQTVDLKVVLMSGHIGTQRVENTSSFQSFFFYASVSNASGSLEISLDEISSPNTGSYLAVDKVTLRYVQNQAPTAVTDVDTTAFETPVSIAVANNDTDPDGTLDLASVAVAVQPQNGTASVDNSGNITYTPNAGFSGDDSLSYTIMDNGGAVSNAAWVYVYVEPPTDLLLHPHS